MIPEGFLFFVFVFFFLSFCCVFHRWCANKCVSALTNVRMFVEENSVCVCVCVCLFVCVCVCVCLLRKTGLKKVGEN